MKAAIKQIFLFFLFYCLRADAQQTGRPPLYFPEADPVKELAETMAAAASSGRHVLLQVGGNWCKWCYRFHDFIAARPALDSILQANYVVQRVNHSKENKNLLFLESMGFPQRFGFPVFVVLNARGEPIHTQDSWYLEDGRESYDAAKVKAFLLNWSPRALEPVHYREKEGQ